MVAYRYNNIMFVPYPKELRTTMKAESAKRDMLRELVIAESAKPVRVRRTKSLVVTESANLCAYEAQSQKIWRFWFAGARNGPIAKNLAIFLFAGKFCTSSSSAAVHTEVMLAVQRWYMELNV